MNKRLERLQADPWYDVVYHALSYLPVPGEDASSVFSPAYTAWADRLFEKEGRRENRIPRSLVEDAPVMAAFYAGSARGHWLHCFPLLWDGVDEFLRDMPAVFSDLAWKQSARADLAAAIGRGVHASLPGLFCTAVWSEIRNGFLALRERAMTPLVRAYETEFAAALDSLSAWLPGLREVNWVLSHPLRVHGRGLGWGRTAHTIAVGVAHEELEVSRTHPVIQACHEYFVFQVAEELGGERELATRPGQAGHEAFVQVETEALALAARFFRGSRWEEAHLSWLAGVRPPTGTPR